jgi:hypothetical protein
VNLVAAEEARKGIFLAVVIHAYKGVWISISISM